MIDTNLAILLILITAVAFTCLGYAMGWIDKKKSDEDSYIRGVEREHFDRRI